MSVATRWRSCVEIPSRDLSGISLVGRWLIWPFPNHHHVYTRHDRTTSSLAFLIAPSILMLKRLIPFFTLFFLPVAFRQLPTVDTGISLLCAFLHLIFLRINCYFPLPPVAGFLCSLQNPRPRNLGISIVECLWNKQQVFPPAHIVNIIQYFSRTNCKHITIDWRT